MALRVKNIIGGSKLNNIKNMFIEKQSKEQNKVMSTGVKIQDRLNMFNKRGTDFGLQENLSQFIPKKLNLPQNFKDEISKNFGRKKSEEINRNENDSKNNEDNNEKDKEYEQKEIINNENEQKNQEMNEENNNEENDEKKEDNNIEENKENKEIIEDEENSEEKSEEEEKLEQNEEQNENEEQKQQNEEIEEKTKEENEGEKEEEKENIKEEEKEEEKEDIKEEEEENQQKEANEEEEKEEVKEEEEKEYQQKEEIEEEEKENNEEKEQQKEEKKEEENKNENINKEEIETEANNEENKEQIQEEEEQNKEGENKIEQKTENNEANQEKGILGEEKKISLDEILGVYNDEIDNLKIEEEPKEIFNTNKNNMKTSLKRTYCIQEKDKVKVKNEKNIKKGFFKRSSCMQTSNEKIKQLYDENNKLNNENDILMKAGTISFEKDLKLLKKIGKPEKPDKRKMTVIRSKRGADLDDFEIVDEYEEGPTVFLDSINYEDYLSDLQKKGIKESPRETFCEGFFIASFPHKGTVIEKSENIEALCGHQECSRLPCMKPEIIWRYPLKDTKNLELNNAAATICFPTGIKICYSETDYPKKIEGYVTQITNAKGERYYMRTLHFYHKMQNIDINKIYEVNPLRHHLMKFGDQYLELSDGDFTDDIAKRVQDTLAFCQELGFRDNIYIPYCICLISKYSYVKELKFCLETIFKIMAQEPNCLNFEINELIMYLINSVPIPIKNMRVRFYIPYNNSKMELICPKIDDVSTMNSKLTSLFDYLSIDNIILIFRLLLSEKKILFIHDNYTYLTNTIDSFISILYPFKWTHTFIPIMSDQMMNVLLTMLPFLNGVHESLMKFVQDVFNDEDFDDKDEVFLVYIKEDKIELSSSLKKNVEKKKKLKKYVENNVLPLPFEKELKKELKSIESNVKSSKRESSKALYVIEIIENKMRDAFIDVFVKMFHDYEKYTGILGNDVIFNKVLFLNTITKDKNFYVEFLESQLFNYYIQNLLSNSCKYFNKKIKEFKEKKNKKNKNFIREDTIEDVIYLAKPDYLGIKDNDKEIIEKTFNEKYKIKLKETEEMKNYILEEIHPIDDIKYNNKNCIIYLIPEKKEEQEDEIKENNKLQLFNEDLNKKVQRNTTILPCSDLTVRQIEQIKDDIKDIVVKIFSSEIIKEDYNNNKNFINILRHLETDQGREYFVSLISNNNNNIISLEEQSFIVLEILIDHIFNSSLKIAETDKLIEEIVILIKCTKYFKKELKKESKKGQKKESKKDSKKFKDKSIELTLFNSMKKKIQNNPKINQENLWRKCFELDLQKRKAEAKHNEISDSEMINLIKDIHRKMNELNVEKNLIKNFIDNLNKSLFSDESTYYNITQLKRK